MTSSRLRALSLCAAISFTAASLPTRTFAQQPTAGDLETARDLNRQGKELRAEGRLQEALEKFKAAHQLGRTPVTGIELARTHMLLGQLVEAREVCLGIARIPPAPDETERSATARAEASKLAEDLRPRIPSLLVRLTGVPPGKTPTITIDNVPLPAAAIGQAHKVNPGVHQIAARIGTGPESSAKVDVKEGETRDVPLLVQAPPEAPPGTGAGPAPGTGASPDTYTGIAGNGARPPRNKLAMIGFTVAGTGVVIGAMGGLLASSKQSNLGALCTADKKCGPNAYDDLDSARTWATVSTIAFALAGVGVVLGVYGLFAKDEKSLSGRVTPYVGPGSVGVHGAF